jgi:tRNA G10  N-methylase Trm11
MQQYFFVLGITPTLSIAEIISHLTNNKYHFEIILLSPEIAVFLLPADFDATKTMQTLGGTVKIGIIRKSLKLDEQVSIENVLTADQLTNVYFSNLSGKLHLGISLYDGLGDQKIFKSLNQSLGPLCQHIKEEMSGIGKKVGFLERRERMLSSVSVAKNGLISHGVEIVLINTPTQILIGKTLAVQAFGAFSLRDYGRPERDKRSGIMPPKLARMMINLAGLNVTADKKPQFSGGPAARQPQKYSRHARNPILGLPDLASPLLNTPDSTLLDPFCGSGTILQEAVLLGHKTIIGTDISEKAVRDTMINIDWLFKNFPSKKQSDYRIDIRQADVMTISKIFTSGTIGAVVTEPFLGPPLYGRLQEIQIKRLFSQVVPLYLGAFGEFAKILPKEGHIVIAFPAVRLNNELKLIPITEEISRMGFEISPLIPKEISLSPPLFQSVRGSVIFGSPEHFLLREIIRFKKK